MTEYVILTCHRTVKFLMWGAEVHGVWTPTCMRYVEKGRGQNKRRVRKRFALAPGYAFVPEVCVPVVVATAPPRFNARVHSRREDGRPRTCTLYELKVMERACNKAATEEDPLLFSVGDPVRIEYHPALMASCDGVLSKFKAAGVARVELDNGMRLDIHCSFLYKI